MGVSIVVEHFISFFWLIAICPVDKQEKQTQSIRLASGIITGWRHKGGVAPPHFLVAISTPEKSISLPVMRPASVAGQ